MGPGAALTGACLNLPGEVGQVYRRDDIELRKVNGSLPCVCGGKGTPGRRNNKNRGSEARMHLASSGKDIWLGMAGEWDVCLRGIAIGDK